MKFISIAIKDLKELLRDRRGLFFILLFPLFFMLIFGFAFGGMGQGNTPYNLAIVNYDQPVTLPSNNQSTNFGNNLTQILKDVKYQNSDVHLFNVTKMSESYANKLLKQRKIDAELIIPENFSKSVVALYSSTILSIRNPSINSLNTSSNVTSTLIIKGDTGFMNFGVSQGILMGILSQYQEDIVIQAQNAARGTPGAQPVQFLNATVEPMTGTQNFTTFDFIAPGIIVFAILMLAINVATILTREVETGTLNRLKLSKMTSFDFLFGGLLPWSLVVIAQVLILFVVAIAIGFHWQGGINSIILAVIVGIIGGISSIALGMIIAAFAKNPPQASQLGTLIAVPISFLVGAFIQLPQVVIGNFMGQQVQIYAIIPWYHILNALRSVLTYGGGWNSIAYELGWAVVLTVILFTIGIILFSRTRLSPENA